MVKLTKSKALQKKLVLRLTHSHLLVTLSYFPEEITVKTRVFSWKLPKIINPNDINPEMEFLGSFLSRMVKSYGLAGSCVSWIIPSTNSKVKVVSVPLNLNIKADKKEFHTLTKATPFDFWKEYDPDLAELRGAEIRSELLTTNAEANSSELLYSACDKQVIRNFHNLSLIANLYPVEFIAADQSLLRIVESRLSRIHREKPFAIFHIAKGESRVIYASLERVEIAKVNIDELDETLLEDIPKLNETNKAFWEDVVDRISNNLKVATNFLLVEAQMPKFENIYFICDYENEDSLFLLLREKYREHNLIMLNRNFEFISIQTPDILNLEKKEENYKFYSGSKFMPNIGAYNMSYFSIPAIPNLIIEKKLFNFHEKHSFITSNFSNENKFRVTFIWLSLILITAIVLTGSSYMFSRINVDINNKFVQSEKNLNRSQQTYKSTNLSYAKKKSKLTALSELMNANDNQKLFLKLLQSIPQGVELDRIIIRENIFQIYGNSEKVEALNSFYSQFVNDESFIDMKVDAYRRSDKPLNWFELVGSIKD